MEFALAKEERAPMDADPLVRRAQNGDLGAFEALLEPRLAALLRLALAIIGDEVDARDAVQQASVHAWRELPRLRDVDRFDPWLNRILTNECRMTLRGRKRRRVREIAISHLDPDRSADFASTEVAGPAERAEQVELLERAFERLNPDDRSLLALRYLDDRNVAEIAAMQGLPETTVQWRVHRARTALKQALDLERR